MFSIKSLFQAVQSWRRRRGGPKAAKRSDIALERLDHRQLLAVNFTGNALIDIPATAGPGTVILTDNGTVRRPGIPADLQPLVKVSGLEINGIRLRYTPEDDILSVALQQPDNQKTGQPVLAGDTDNNGNGATVDPAVQALRPSFLDFGFLGGSESMGAFLDLNNDNVPDVVAGVPSDPQAGKLYQVADAVVNPDPSVAARTIPRFGAMRLTNTGASFLTNDPNRPSFEFQVTNFSQLYQQKTGGPLRTDSVIKVGAFGNSNDDDGISEAFFPAQNVNFGVVPPAPTPPTPPTPVPCPPVPVRPPIFINPHAQNHVNTAHPTDVRVTVLGSRKFDATAIIPGSVRLGGAAPISTFLRDVDRDGTPDRTLIFRGSDLNLPRGRTRAIVTGTLSDGTTFRSGEPIFNRNDSFYTPAQIAARDARQNRRGFDATNPPLTPSQENARGRGNVRTRTHDLALDQAMKADRKKFASANRPTVKVRTRPGTSPALVVVSSSSSVVVTTSSGPAAISDTQPGRVHAPTAPAGAGGARNSLLTQTAKRDPVAQREAPVTVKIPRRKSIVIPEITAAAARPRTRPVVGAAPRAAWARAGSTAHA